jgi:GNAT superfamily N-acetyltransferase
MHTDSIINVREALPVDVPLILSFIRKKAAFDKVPHWVEATEDRLFSELFGPNPKAFVIFAEIDKHVIGFAICFFTFSSFLAKPGIWLDDLFVDEEFRGRGAGSALLTYLARISDSRGYGRIEWVTAATNEKGLDFYKRNGAEVQERIRVLRLNRSEISRLSKAGAA